jgi:hypothetical protein
MAGYDAGDARLSDRLAIWQAVGGSMADLVFHQALRASARAAALSKVKALRSGDGPSMRGVGRCLALRIGC